MKDLYDTPLDEPCPDCGRMISRPCGPYEIKLHMGAFHRGYTREQKKSLLQRAQPIELQEVAPINLDAMTPTALSKFWAKYHRPSRADAAHLVGDRPRARSVAQALANYAINKATGMTCRLRGDINAASIYEGIADRIYEKLPEDVRW